jgi:hypothetical protein
MTADDSHASDASETDAEAAASSPFEGGDLLEAVIMVASAVLIVAVLGYLVSQALVTPAAPDPTATVDAVEPLPAGEEGPGRTRVTVSLDNDGELGLSSVEVVVECGRTERSLTFTQVPARGHRTGTVVCPQGTTPTASVATWIEA